MRFNQVEAPFWGDRPVYVIGGGPSLTGRAGELAQLHKRGWVLGVNRATRPSDEAPVHIPVHATFSLDYNFMRHRFNWLVDWAQQHELYLAVADDYDDEEGQDLIPGARYLERVQGRGLSCSPSKIINGLNSGYGAFNLAILKGAREIYLLGFDLRDVSDTQPIHWHDSYPWQNRRTKIYWPRWAERFREAREVLPKGVQVFNVNPRSRVDAFPKIKWEEMP